MQIIRELKGLLSLAQEQSLDVILGSCWCRFFGGEDPFGGTEDDEKSFCAEEKEFLQAATKSAYDRFLGELSAEELLDEDGDEDIFREIALLGDVLPQTYNAAECAFSLYYVLTDGVKKEERLAKIKDIRFRRQFEEELFGEMRTVLRRPDPTDPHFSERAPFVIYCRKLCDLMIDGLGRICRKGRSRTTRIYTLGVLLIDAFRTALGCVHALTIGDDKGAVSGWRALYEKECTVIVLHKEGNIIRKRFVDWRKYDYLHDPEKELTPELREDMENCRVRGAPINYRHYGWVAPLCEEGENVGRESLERLAGQTERKDSYQRASEVAHGTHVFGKTEVVQMQKFLLRELPVSLERLVGISLEELEAGQRRRGETDDGVEELGRRARETLAYIRKYIPAL